MDEAMLKSKVQKDLQDVFDAVKSNQAKIIVRRFKDLSKEQNYDAQKE